MGGLVACAFTGPMVSCGHDLAIAGNYFSSVYAVNSGK